MNPQTLSDHQSIYHFERVRLLDYIRRRYFYVAKNDAAQAINFQLLEDGVSESGIAGLWLSESAGPVPVFTAKVATRGQTGWPTKVEIYQRNTLGTQVIPQVIDFDDPRFIPLLENSDVAGRSVDLNYFYRRLAKIRVTIDSRLSVLNTPLVAKVRKEKREQAGRVLNRYNNAIPIWIDDKMTMSDTLSVVDLKVEYLIDKLEREYQTIEKQFLTRLGYTTNNVDKQERLITSENEKGNDLLLSNDFDSFRWRQIFVERIKEWGLEVELVKPNLTIYEDAVDATSKVEGVPHPEEFAHV